MEVIPEMKSKEQHEKPNSPSGSQGDEQLLSSRNSPDNGGYILLTIHFSNNCSTLTLVQSEVRKQIFRTRLEIFGNEFIKKQNKCIKLFGSQ